MGRFGKSLLFGFAFGFGGEASFLLAQCAMCRTAVAGSSHLGEIARVLNTAILTLLIPPVVLLSLVFWLALTFWNRTEDRSERGAEDASAWREPVLMERSGDRGT